MPFYQGGGAIPSGLISLWRGTIATIPAGWVLCNGLNGTPDLRNVFIVGANADNAGVSNTEVTGSPTKSGGEYLRTANFYVSTGSPTGDVSLTAVGASYASSTTHYHDVTGATDEFEILPPYYALAYIMKL
jgi:hypothetical protein